jgi:hypothetical protein
VTKRFLGVLCGSLATGLSYGWWTGKRNRYQAWLLVLMLFLEAISLHAASIRAMTRRSARTLPPGAAASPSQLG